MGGVQLEPKDWVTYICAGAGLLAALIAAPPSRARNPAAVAAVVLFASAGIMGLANQHGRDEQTGNLSPRHSSAEISPHAPAASSGPGIGRTVSVAVLQPGDCIAGGDLRLDNSAIALPLSTQVLACDQQHDGEVFLGADPWVEDADFPGEEAVTELVNSRCEETFQSYIGTKYEKSVLEYVGSNPSAETWDDGDRHILCIAYDPQGKLTGSVRRTSM